MKINIFICLLILSCGYLSIKSARTFPESLPESIPTDPDKDRPLGRCNADSDCSSGSNCSSFGWCGD